MVSEILRRYSTRATQNKIIGLAPCSALFAVVTALTLSTAPVFAQLPGDPLIPVFGPVDILTEGATILPGPVVPGDVVMFETPTGNPNDRTTWSDVIRFFNYKGAGWAYMMSDSEAGPGAINISGYTYAPSGNLFVSVPTFTMPDAL